jgi:septum formation protein
MMQMLDPLAQASLWLAAEPLVLASRSTARQALLAAAGIPFDVDPADVDERAIEAGLRAAAASPEVTALELARAKAEVISRRHPGRLVLGADQVLALGERIFAKPGDRAAAARQLATLSGRTHALHSAAIVLRDGACLCEATDVAFMEMRALSAIFVAHYLDLLGDSAFSSVGAYQIEGLGLHLFTAIEGNHATIMGLPMLQLLAFLRRHGSLVE